MIRRQHRNDRALDWAKGKRVVLISHDFTQSGSPLFLIELAAALREAGADIRLVTLADDAGEGNLAARNGVPLLARRDSFDACSRADFVIVNTAVAAPWVGEYLTAHPEGARSLLWWIHEIDPRPYAEDVKLLERVAVVVFDSHASLRNWRDVGGLVAAGRVIHPCIADDFVEAATASCFSYAARHLLKTLRFGDARGVRSTTGEARRAERDAAPGRAGPARSRRAGTLAVRAVADVLRGLNATGFARRVVRKDLGIERGDFVATLIGTYIPRKGHAPFVDAIGRLLRKHPGLPLKAIVVGFAYEEQKTTFIDTLEDAGRRAVDPRRALTIARDLSPYYAASDAFVMNSQGLGENFGRVTLEAMAFRLPVLGTNAGGTVEIVQHGVTGLLHPVGVDGTEKLAENVLLLMRDRDLARALGEAGSTRVRDVFGAARFYDELGAALGPLLASDRRPRRPRE